MVAFRSYLLTFLIAIAAADTVSAQEVFFVNAAADSGGDGSSWARAFTHPGPALSQAMAGDQIWIAAGTYRPGTNRTDSFQLVEGVEIYGGLAGIEVPGTFDLTDRDPTQFETILDGEIGAPGAADNSFHIVVASGVSRSTVFDGVTITRAHASGLTQSLQDIGGGLLNLNASPTIRNCLFLQNRAGTRGAAVHVASGAPLFTHCRFVQNQTTVTQASNNLGGAIYYAGTAANPASPMFVNCFFSGNRAGVGNGGSGGVMYGAASATATLINCTLVHNRADTLAAGVFGTANVVNSILYDNQDRNGFELTANLRGTVAASYSLVQGGWPGVHIVNASPLFANSSGDDGVPGTRDDDTTIQSGSPCIDAGDNLAWPAGVRTVDLAGFPRFANDPNAVDTGHPIGASLCDLGVYEVQFECVVNDDCDDGLYCNGSEICQGSECRSGDAPNCSDDVACTRDSCSESLQSCLHLPDNSLCDNGAFCDGAETCDSSAGCVAGTPPDCDDSVSCTTDQCSDLSNQCEHIPDEVGCDDGQFCNGMESCRLEGCLAGTPPCEPPLSCNEVENRCTTMTAGCTSSIECEDGNPCTDHACASGICETAFNDSVCNDNNACTSADICTAGTCVGIPIPNCGQGPVDPGPGDDDPPPPDSNDPPADPDEDADTPDETDEPDQDDEATDEDDPTTDPPAESCEQRGDCETDDEPDDDGDGVEDQFDLCPLTPSGSQVSANGCSEDQDEPGRGIQDAQNGRRCGTCGAIGSLGVLGIVCVPGAVLIIGRPRGRK